MSPAWKGATLSRYQANILREFSIMLQDSNPPKMHQNGSSMMFLHFFPGFRFLRRYRLGDGDENHGRDEKNSPIGSSVRMGIFDQSYL